MNAKRLPRPKWPILLFALLLAGVLLLSGCGGGDDASSSAAASSSDPSSADASSAASSDASASGSDSSSNSSASVSEPPAPAVSLRMNTDYTCLNEARYPAGRAPHIAFTETSFSFVFNTGEGAIGTMAGSYTLAGNALTLTVESCDITDFRGEKQTELPFTVQDDYRLVYNGDYLGLTWSGDVFETADAPPPGTSAPAESSPAPDASTAQATAASLQIGTTYTCLNEARYPAERAPHITFTETNYTLVFNSGEGAIGTITGSYTLSGNALTLAVESCDITDFRGEKQTELPFTVQDGYRLVYSGDYLGLTWSGDVFETAGAPPAVQPESSAPDSSPAAAASSSDG